MNTEKFAKEQQWKKLKMSQAGLNRFERDEFTIDIWVSKKGTTVGVYHEETARYLKEVSKEDVVEILVDPDYLRKNNLGKLTKRWRK